MGSNDIFNDINSTVTVISIYLIPTNFGLEKCHSHDFIINTIHSIYFFNEYYR